MQLWKLTTQDGKTRVGQYNETQWGEGVTHTAPGEGDLCSAGWIHAYTDPLLALLLNPIHANIPNPALWEASGEIGIRDGELKVGVTSLTMIRRVDVPQITTLQRVAFGIYAALEVCSDPRFTAWAEKWLSGEDRSHVSAAVAAVAAEAAAETAVAAAETAAEAAAKAAKAEAAKAAKAAVAAVAAAAAVAAEAAKAGDVDLLSCAFFAMGIE